MQSDDTATNLYHNDGEHKYLRVEGKHYKWRIGKGWFSLNEADVPINIAWTSLPDKMLSMFRPELPH